MDKIKLSTADINFILSWRDENKDLVRLALCPLKSAKIICYETGINITVVRDENIINFNINQNGNTFGSFVFEVMNNGMCKLIKDKSKLNTDNKQSILTIYLSTMALIVFGNTPTIQSRDKLKNTAATFSTSKKKTKSTSITYILRRNKSGEPRIMASGSHNAPQGIFSVRGHYRHYKNGKVIWIREYRKGEGKKKSKIYKI